MMFSWIRPPFSKITFKCPNLLELTILNPLTNSLSPKIHHTKQSNMSKSITKSTHLSPSFHFPLTKPIVRYMVLINWVNLFSVEVDLGDISYL